MAQSIPFVAKRMRSSDDEARSPKYAHLERERRWLVDPAKSALVEATDPITITDHYIAGTRLRLRRMACAGSPPSFKLTRKYECSDPLARPIVTAYLTDAEFDVFAALPSHIIQKRRFLVREDGHDFSVDRFDGALAGLELAEIEMTDDAELRNLPDPAWTVRDVSSDSRYQGGTLVVNGIPRE